MAIINRVKSEGSFYSASAVQIGSKTIYSSVTQNKSQASNSEAIGMVILAAGATAAYVAGSQICKGVKALWKKF
jgi:hypothetical protein